MYITLYFTIVRRLDIYYLYSFRNSLLTLYTMQFAETFAEYLYKFHLYTPLAKDVVVGELVLTLKAVSPHSLICRLAQLP